MAAERSKAFLYYVGNIVLDISGISTKVSYDNTWRSHFCSDFKARAVYRLRLSDEKLILVILNDRQSIGLPVDFYYPYFTEIDLEICY